MSKRTNRGQSRSIEASKTQRTDSIVVAHRASIEAYSGPLPPPEELVKYNQAYDGCARDIVEMAKLQQQARITLETKVVDQACRSSTLGSIFGFAIFALIAVLVYLYAVSTSVWEALWAETIPLLGLLVDRIFAYVNRKRDLKEKEENRPELIPDQRDSENNQNQTIDMPQA